MASEIAQCSILGKHVRRRRCSAMVQKIPDPIRGRLLNDVIPTKAGEPFHAVFLAKPCHLALGIAARISLRVEDRLLDGQLAVEHLDGLAIAVRFKWLDAWREAARKDGPYFVKEPALEHLLSAPVEPL